MLMKVCIVRHGETDWNAARRLQGRADVPLNENGVAQALAAANCLAGEAWHWDMVITSPLIRAKRTAEIIAAGVCADALQEDVRLIERDYGEGSGLVPEVRKAMYPDGNYPGLETFDALQGRICAAFQAACEAHNGKNLIIVSHGGAINSLLSALSCGEIGAGKTRLKTGCLNRLEVECGKTTIVSVNEVPSS